MAPEGGRIDISRYASHDQATCHMQPVRPALPAQVQACTQRVTRASKTQFEPVIKDLSLHGRQRVYASCNCTLGVSFRTGSFSPSSESRKYIVFGGLLDIAAGGHSRAFCFEQSAVRCSVVVLCRGVHTQQIVGTAIACCTQ